MTNLAMPLTQLGLRQRTLRMLAAAEIGTAAKLVACSDSGLRARSLDDRSIVDVIECLEMHGLTLIPSDVVDSAPSSEADPAKRTAVGFDTKPSLFLGEPKAVDRISEAPQLLEGAIDETDFSNLEQAFYGVELRKKRATKSATKTDDRRADAFALRMASVNRRKADRPSRHDARVVELRETVTLTVEEAAFLYHVSRDAIYDAVKRPGGGNIPHTRIGKRVVIPTRHVFAALGLD